MTAKHSFDSPEQLGTKKMSRWCRCDRTMPTKQSTPKKMNFVTAAKREGYMKKGGFKPLPKRNSDAYKNKVRHMK